MDRLQKVLDNFKQTDNAVAAAILLGLGVTGGVVLKKRLRSIFFKLGFISGSKFASINSTEAGARSQVPLKKGKHPIQLHSLGTPNGQKITVLFEELGLKYDAFVINIMKQDQFGSGFVEINPNSKIPAVVDYTEDKENGQRIYESGSILLHFAEKTGKLIPKDPKLRTECLNLLFMQMGSAPYFGQFGHFQNYAPKGFWEDHSYSLNRYSIETQRIVSVLNNILSDGRKFLVGDEYTIADVAWYPWINCIDEFYNSWDLLNLNRFTHVVRWRNEIKERPAVKKGMLINQPWRGENAIGDYSSPE